MGLFATASTWFWDQVWHSQVWGKGKVGPIQNCNTSIVLSNGVQLWYSTVLYSEKDCGFLDLYTRRVLDKNIRLRIQKRPPFLPNKI